MGVLAYHVVFSCYGFWLPNDPRGSWSDFVRQGEILKLGQATKTGERRSVAHQWHDQESRRGAKRSLRFPPVTLNGEQARAAARGFLRASEESSYRVHACAIMPDHVHLVVENHERRIEKIVQHLQARATQRMRAEGVHPFSHRCEDDPLPSRWAKRTGWTVYLNSRADIDRCVRCVEQNPVRAGYKAQSWNLVTQFDS